MLILLCSSMDQLCNEQMCKNNQIHAMKGILLGPAVPPLGKAGELTSIFALILQEDHRESICGVYST